TQVELDRVPAVARAQGDPAPVEVAGAVHGVERPAVEGERAVEADVPRDGGVRIGGPRPGRADVGQRAAHEVAGDVARLPIQLRIEALPAELLPVVVDPRILLAEDRDAELELVRPGEGAVAEVAGVGRAAPLEAVAGPAVGDPPVSVPPG